MNARMRMTKRPARGSNPPPVILRSVATKDLVSRLCAPLALAARGSVARGRSGPHGQRSDERRPDSRPDRGRRVSGEGPRRGSSGRRARFEIVGECASGPEAVAAIGARAGPRSPRRSDAGDGRFAVLAKVSPGRFAGGHLRHGPRRACSRGVPGHALDYLEAVRRGTPARIAREPGSGSGPRRRTPLPGGSSRCSRT
jgi:hypothetical protein